MALPLLAKHKLAGVFEVEARASFPVHVLCALCPCPLLPSLGAAAPPDPSCGIPHCSLAPVSAEPAIHCLAPYGIRTHKVWLIVAVYGGISTIAAFIVLHAQHVETSVYMFPIVAYGTLNRVVGGLRTVYKDQYRCH